MADPTNNTALWTALIAAGAAAVSGVLTYLGTRRKADVDGTSAQLGHLNVATKQLIDSLFAQIKDMRDEMEKLKSDYENCEKKHKQAQEEVDELRAEMRELRTSYPVKTE